MAPVKTRDDLAETPMQRLLADELDAVLAESSSSWSLHDWLVERTPAIKAWLVASLGDDGELERIVSAGYEHANGFFKIPLARSSSGVLRLHIWTGMSVVGNIHNHRWPLASTILMGSLRTEFFVEADSGQPTTVFRYRSQAETTTPDQLIESGTAQLSAAGGFDLPINGSYQLPAMTLHRAQTTSNGTITLMVRGAAIRDETSVMAPQGASPVERGQGLIDLGAVRRAIHRLSETERA